MSTCVGSVKGTDEYHSSGSGAIPTPTLHFAAIDQKDASILVQAYHYKHAPAGSVSWAYGAFVDGEMIAAVTFGTFPSPQIARSIGTPYPLTELNRLVIAEYAEIRKNLASSLVGFALRSLPKPLVVVSYADTAEGHVGYVYQATNFLYAGAATAHDSLYRFSGETLHPRTLASRGISAPAKWAKEVGAERVLPQPKHRYVYIVAEKRDKAAILASIKWPLSSAYPKKVA